LKQLADMAKHPHFPGGRTQPVPLRFVRVAKRLLFAGLALSAGPAIAQQLPVQQPPAGSNANPFPANPLPNVVYPSRDPDTAPPERAWRDQPPSDVPPPDYVLVDGVWGYWDRERHFHPRTERDRFNSDGRRPGIAQEGMHQGILRDRIVGQRSRSSDATSFASGLPGARGGVIVGAPMARGGR
jgi:hypothetical protein